MQRIHDRATRKPELFGLGVLAMASNLKEDIGTQAALFSSRQRRRTGLDMDEITNDICSPRIPICCEVAFTVSLVTRRQWDGST